MEPTDQTLYNSIKKKYQDKMENSAYRSGLIVKSYKKAYFDKYGKNDPYKGKKSGSKTSKINSSNSKSNKKTSGSKSINKSSGSKSINKSSGSKSINKSSGSKSNKDNGIDRKSGLSRWFAEKWRNESGKVGYDKKNILYRPTRRVTDKTPKTWSELNKKQISNAKNKKKKYGRVNKF
jgi:hypothetical protein